MKSPNYLDRSQVGFFPAEPYQTIFKFFCHQPPSPAEVHPLRWQAFKTYFSLCPPHIYMYSGLRCCLQVCFLVCSIFKLQNVHKSTCKSSSNCPEMFQSHFSSGIPTRCKTVKYIANTCITERTISNSKFFEKALAFSIFI